jgi:glycosyltransferase involved in cell wall biosynthesis
MSKLKPAIVVVAYNREVPLERLLEMLLQASYPSSDIPLVICIDGGGSDAVIQLARSFEWKHGNKEIILHPQNRGLKDNILFCGDLAERYGSVIILEDDLLVSPAFYEYSVAVVSSGRLNDASVSGASLYSYRTNETSATRFYPIDDGFDNYYLQMPSSWGQIWTKESWHGFRAWYDLNCRSDVNQWLQNRGVTSWGKANDTSWKRYYAAYMEVEGKYMLYPRVSFSDNPGEVGEHHVGADLYRASLALTCTSPFNFSKMKESSSIYDQNFEICRTLVRRLNSSLDDLDFRVCLNASKVALSNSYEFLLVPLNGAVPDVNVTWGNIYYPIELNILLNVPGDDIGLMRKEKYSAEFRTNQLLEASELLMNGHDCLKLLILKIKKTIWKRYQ